MNIADRIQHLRKSRGILQEELADQIGVSRQAVSKWESEQSIPDLEKIILLSDYFETTTDFLLKGIEPAAETERKCSAMIFAVCGTMVNAIGLVISIVIWIERQMAYAVGAGLAAMLLGTGIFLIGQVVESEEKRRALRLFLLPNSWILLLIPMSCVFNLLDGLAGGYAGQIAPIPLLGNSFLTLGLFWIVYVAVCAAITLYVGRHVKENQRRR